MILGCSRFDILDIVLMTSMNPSVCLSNETKRIGFTGITNRWSNRFTTSLAYTTTTTIQFRSSVRNWLLVPFHEPNPDKIHSRQCQDFFPLWQSRTDHILLTLFTHTWMWLFFHMTGLKSSPWFGQAQTRGLCSVTFVLSCKTIDREKW